MRVHGKVALVTGGASGLGAACADRLAAEGAQVVVADRQAASGPHRFEALDVTDEAAWDRVMATVIEAFGRLDILVNCAGIGVGGDIERATLKEFRLVQAVNVEGTFLGCRAAVRAMKATGGGSIINVSSVAGLVGDPDLAAYCASKGAVRLLTKSVALHCARERYAIRCNSVHPSYFATPMVDRMIAAAPDPDKARRRLEHAAALGRMGEPDEVGDLIVYLASDESRFMTGAELVIDGGATAR